MSCAATPVRAQDEAIVESLAGILAASDARRYTGPLFRAAARHADPIVRRHAALAMGRIGNPAAIAILLRLTSDPDTVVQRDALFSVGVLAVPEALDRLRDIVLNTPSGEQGGAQAEAVAAVAKIGGVEAVAVVTELLNRWVGIATTGMLPAVVERALVEAWRLGPDAPISLVAQFTEAASGEARRKAVYSLVTLRATSVINALLRATGDPVSLVRALGVAALTADFADDAGLDRRGVAARVRGLVNDPDPGVRIAALRALSTYGTDDYVSLAADRASDTDPNVRVQALAALGTMTGPAAIEALSRRLGGGIIATRRQALLSLAQVSGADALEEIQGWMASAEWRERATAADALARLPANAAKPDLDRLLGDRDPRVVAAALRATLSANTRAADSIGRRYMRHNDPVVRTAAVDALTLRPGPADVELLLDAYQIAGRDPTSRSRVEIVIVLGRVAQQDRATLAEVASRFLARFPASDDYLVRQAAERWLPPVADQWGPARPIDTGRGIEDYRDLARDLVLAAERGESSPEIIVETDRGNLTIELFGADAPLTVQSFLRLVDRRHFDALPWYGVDPAVILETGDQRGDGVINAVAPVRDELHSRLFGRGTLGLVLDGPDTGGNRFFVTLRPSPGLENTHTALGRVVLGAEVLARITTGDRIRRIRRQ